MTRKNKIKCGIKFDTNKLRWGLIPGLALQEIVKVLNFGASKYAPDNWKLVKGRRWRYFDASMRHLMAWKEDANYGRNPELSKDPETGISHLAHAGACILFLLWCDLFPSKDDEEGLEKHARELPPPKGKKFSTGLK